MSGFEIAGLVLGAFPILLNVLDYYERSFVPLDEWWHFRRHFVHFVDDVSQQQMLFQQNLALLLDPVIDDNDMFTSLLNDSGAAAWQTSSLSDILGKRLGVHRARFLRTLIEMDESDWACDGGTWEHELRRLRLSFSKGKARRIEKLAKLNRDLSGLLGWSDTVLPLKERRTTSKLTARCERLRQHYFNLHTALICRWRCACPQPHDTSLVIQRPAEDDGIHAIDLVFVLPAAATQPASSAILRKVSASIQQEELGGANRVAEESNLTSALHHLTVNAESGQWTASPGFLRPLLGKPKGGMKKAAQAGPTKGTGTNAQCTTGAVRHARFCNDEPKAQDDPTKHSLTDLCAVLRQDHVSKGDYGSVIDYMGRGYALHPQQPPIQVAAPAELKSLSSNLTNSSFERQQRFSLAVVLVVSLLQLHSTPWAPDCWTKDSVQLLHDGRSWSYDSAYFTHSFASIPGFGGPPTPDTGVMVSENQVRDMLFSIGVMLLELIFNKPIESHPKRRLFFGPDNQPAEHTDECTAREWSKSVLGECGIEVSDVIRRCLDCSFGPPPDLRDKKFREALEVHIIEPLGQVCNKLWPTISSSVRRK